MSSHFHSLETLQESVDCFKIVIAYQDQECAQRGVRVCDKIAAGLGKAFDLSRVMWKLDLLEVAAMRELASDDVANSDMIIFAMHQDADLSENVHAWMQAGVSPASAKPRALVALFSQGIDNTQSGAFDHLRELAQANDLDFFSNVESSEDSISVVLPA